jgi:hypothetical protein
VWLNGVTVQGLSIEGVAELSDNTVVDYTELTE